MRKALLYMLCIAVIVAAPAFAASPKSGTTLAATKTVDICVAGDGSWFYSGVIAVWNQGAIDTVGLTIQDCIQSKNGAGQFADVSGLCTTTFNPAVHEVVAGTTQFTADTYTYGVAGAPLTGDIRNIARLRILNHSSAIGTPTGPDPKATWTGGVPPPCNPVCGCVFTQGYWGSKPDVVWPYSSRDALFYLSGLTWQQIMDASVAGGNAYVQLAHQYIAALQNQANGACVPAGVQDVLNQASAWFAVNLSTACSAHGSCGTQKDWAATLDLYNNGNYPQGPSHCGE